jgi:2-hydroxychromene-2-carboxylate isomerase
LSEKKTIDFYFSFISLYTYIGYEAFQNLVTRLDLQVNYKPIDLHAIFTASGGLPVSKRPPQRQAYRLVEMQRWALTRNIPLVLKPRHHPSNPEIGHRMLLAAINNKQDVKEFIGNALKILWLNDLNIEDPKVMITTANQSGLDGKALYEQINNEAITKEIEALTQEGLERQVFGTPFFFYQNEPFWGQDRLEMLEDLIVSNRKPIPSKSIGS